MSVLGQEALTRRRYAAGSWSASTGKYTAGGSTDTTFYGSVDPAPERQLQLLSEGQRQRDPRLVITEDALSLKTASQYDKTKADRVLISGAWYQVHTVKEYRSVLPGTEAIVLRVQEADPG